MSAAVHELSTDARSDIALAELFDAHCNFVWRSLRHLGVDESALDDAVQDVFVIAYRRWSSFRGASTPRTWLFGIARRVAWRQRRAAHVRASRHVAATAAHEPSHEPFERVHAIQSLSRLLGGLDRDKRAVFVLAELEGLTAPEVSEALGIPLGTAYSRLRAAWQSLGKSAGREDERLRRTLSVARSAAPSPERRDRMWAAIAAGLPAIGTGAAGGLGAAIAGATQTHAWTVVIVALGIGLLGASFVASRPAGDRGRVEPDSAAGRDGAEATSRRGAPPRSSATLAPSDAPDPRTRSAAAIAAPNAVPNADPPSRPRGSTSSSRAPSPSAIDRAAPRPESDGAADALTQELVLLRAAKRALAAARPADALVSLQAHARRFPSGQLAADRDALMAAARKMQPAAIDPGPADTSVAEEPER